MALNSGAAYRSFDYFMANATKGSLDVPAGKPDKLVLRQLLTHAFGQFEQVCVRSSMSPVCVVRGMDRRLSDMDYSIIYCGLDDFC